MINRILDNPGRSIKKLAEILFCLGSLIAVILFIVGSRMFFQGLSEMGGDKDLGKMLTYTYEQVHIFGAEVGVTGRIIAGDAVRLFLASLCCLPLYGFGCLVEDTAAIKNAIVVEKQKPVEKAEQD